MRLMPPLPVVAVLALAANLAVVSCHDDDDDDFVFVDDVTVEITGDAGTDFDATFRDDDSAQSVSSSVPFTSDFLSQENFFRAVVDKDSSGTEEICVRLIASGQSRQACTDDPFGQVTVTVVF